ncbi:flagellar motor switch protein FliM [Thermanaerovibrio acidaminovorans DSM 6589]|uniref:Flagellar motor switch protein FliM n=1 Tax=Thermanaerovibrio acidaminovorans (strain ATCC 49978 / DSM 6589 / Su883) TaxID=525903 RepID=D1B6B3_THEAS|nr:flagellar motor switch protein FliM [Thermanaerovibrio acidaminovorans]ACZ19554.1 flagellar motor switch protein FliM [Thermanaerovibrio acidaminovorans DSM 6589]
MVPEVLSQNEIDSLLQALSSGSVDLAAIESKDDRKIKVYDFRRPDKFSKDQLRAIQMIHDSFARQLTTSLSTLVRSMVSSEVVSVDQLAYDEFIRSLVQPTVIGVLEMYPLSGNAVLEMNPHLVFAIIDRMLGGKGEPIRKPRDLTDIERTVVERVMLKILEHLEESWSTVVDIRFRFESMESNPFFVQICPGTDMVLLVTLKVQVGEAEGIMNLCIPYFVMEPMIDKLSSQHWFASTGRKNVEGAREIIEARLSKVAVPVALELGHTVLSLGDVLQLREGDVIRLDAKTSDPLGLRVGNRVKFLCEAGSFNKHYAARVLEVLSSEEGLAHQGED